MCVPNFIALRRSGGELNLANRQIKLCENDNFGPWGGERLFLGFETLGSQESLLRWICVPNFIALRRSGGALNLANRQIKSCKNDNFGPWGGEQIFLSFETVGSQDTREVIEVNKFAKFLRSQFFNICPMARNQKWHTLYFAIFAV